MESGIVVETKYRKTRTAQMKISVFATANSAKKVLPPLLTRFALLCLVFTALKNLQKLEEEYFIMKKV